MVVRRRHLLFTIIDHTSKEKSQLINNKNGKMAYQNSESRRFVELSETNDRGELNAVQATQANQPSQRAARPAQQTNHALTRLAG
jgi:hypothetical protein